MEASWRDDFGLFREYYLASNRFDYVKSGIHHAQWAGILENSLTQLPIDEKLKDKNFDPSRIIPNITGKYNRKIVIQAPREHAKSSLLTVDYPIWELYKNPNLRIVIVSSTKAIAQAFLREITMNLENNQLLTSRLGSLIPDQPEKWTDSEIIINRTAAYKDPSIAVVGSGGAILSRRADILILDDILSPDNTRTEDQRIKMKDWFHQVLFPILVPNGRMIVGGTIFNPEDLLTVFMGDSTFDVRLRYRSVLDFDTHEVLWPERHSYASLAEKKESMGSTAFNMAYQNEVIDDETALIKRSWVERAKTMGQGYKIFEAFNRKASIIGDVIITFGVDLQSREKKQTNKPHAFAIVVLAVRLSDGARIPLHVYREIGLSMAQQENAIYALSEIFDPDLIFVESNGYQEMLSRDMKDRTPLPIKSFETTKEKHDLEIGIHSLAVLLENEKMIIPTKSDNIKLSTNMKYLTEGLIAYDPNKHTEDSVMALWFANVAARSLEKNLGKYKKVNTKNNLFNHNINGKEKPYQIVL